MTVTLVLPQQIADALFEAAVADVETAGVLLARHVKTPNDDVRLLAREMHWVPDDAYLVRDATALSIASHGYLPALRCSGGRSVCPYLAACASWKRINPPTKQTRRDRRRGAY